MNAMRWVFAGLVGLTLCLGAVAQAPTPEGDPPGGAEESVPERPPAAPPQAEEDDRTLEDIFIPSEEIAADEEITFPINI